TVKADNLCGSSGLRTLYYVPGCRLAEEDAAGISSLTVYPNPAHTQATVAFKAAEQGSYMLIMTDVTGRTVRSMVTTAQAGVHQTDINLNDLAKGMYLIELRSNSGTEVQKLIVE
ncbi:MAG: T9SS type A sorting domain-containing protein, partial [Bacteroidia bacterium]|nr:T9SS type A sorting domain-containing protein [Bacteroidia bacterium]